MTKTIRSLMLMSLVMMTAIATAGDYKPTKTECGVIYQRDNRNGTRTEARALMVVPAAASDQVDGAEVMTLVIDRATASELAGMFALAIAQSKDDIVVVQARRRAVREVYVATNLALSPSPTFQASYSPPRE